MQLIKKVVGMETFTREYAASNKQLGDKREARKGQRAAEVRFQRICFNLLDTAVSTHVQLCSNLEFCDRYLKCYHYNILGCI